MTRLARHPELVDPDAAVYLADAYGDVIAGVYVHDLDGWAFALHRIESWIAYAAQSTHDDYTAFVVERYGPCGGPQLSELMWMVATMAARMDALVNGAPE